MPWVIYLAVLTSCVHLALCASATETSALLNGLLNSTKYDTRVRPLQNQSHQVEVNVSFNLAGILEFDEVAEKIETAGFLILTWKDEFLTWDPVATGIFYIKVPETTVWTPDLINANTLKKMKKVGDGARLVAVRYDGLVIFMPGDLFGTGCSVDVTYFPYDKQNCDILFASWNYYGFEVALNSPQDDVSLTVYEQNSGWDVTGSSAAILFYTDPDNSKLTYYQVKFGLSMTRRTAYHTQASLIPSILLTILSCFVFLLPAESGEKVSYIISLFLTLAVYITYIADNMPQTSKTTSIFLIYLTVTLFLIGTGVLLSIVSVFLSTRPSNHTIPNCIRKIVIKIKKRKAKNKGTESVKGEDKNTSEEGVEVTWHDLTVYLDFFCFWLSVVIVVLLNIVILSMLISS